MWHRGPGCNLSRRCGNGFRALYIPRLRDVHRATVAAALCVCPQVFGVAVGVASPRPPPTRSSSGGRSRRPDVRRAFANSNISRPCISSSDYLRSRIGAWAHKLISFSAGDLIALSRLRVRLSRLGGAEWRAARKISG